MAQQTQQKTVDTQAPAQKQSNVKQKAPAQEKQQVSSAEKKPNADDKKAKQKGAKDSKSTTNQLGFDIKHIREYIMSYTVFLAVFVLLEVMLFIFFARKNSDYRFHKSQLVEVQEKQSQVGIVSTDDMRLLHSAFIKSDSVIDFIQDVESSRSYFSKFELTFTSDVPQGARILYYPFVVDATGSIENITSFIDALSNSSYIVDIRGVDITYEENGGRNPLLHLEGYIYIRK